jgi:hypothetical protein
MEKQKTQDSKNIFFLFSFFLFFFFPDRDSLYSPSCPGTHSVDQASLELRNLPASAFPVLGLKASATTAWQHKQFFCFVLFCFSFSWIFSLVNFTCYPLSRSPAPNPPPPAQAPISSLLPLFYEGVPPPTHSCLCFSTQEHHWTSLTLGHQAFTGPRASPPTDAPQSHPLLYMQLESWIPPSVLLGWWFSPWEL